MNNAHEVKFPTRCCSQYFTFFCRGQEWLNLESDNTKDHLILIQGKSKYSRKSYQKHFLY